MKCLKRYIRYLWSTKNAIGEKRVEYERKLFSLLKEYRDSGVISKEFEEDMVALCIFAISSRYIRVGSANFVLSNLGVASVMDVIDEDLRSAVDMYIEYKNEGIMEAAENMLSIVKAKFEERVKDGRVAVYKAKRFIELMIEWDG